MTDLAIRILIIVCIVFGLGAYVTFRGYVAGTEHVQRQWDAERESREKASQKAKSELEAKLAASEARYAEREQKITAELAQVAEQHLAALRSQRIALEQRLLQSTRRSEIYRDQAEGSEASCRDLASHAAKLDRALEEGRGLVQELSGTLGLRDRQVILLGDQIKSDRLLLDEEGTPQ